MFCEWFGYVSPLLDTAIDICDGKVKSPQLVKAIEIDAYNTFQKLSKDYTKEELDQWWDEVYEIYLKERIQAYISNKNGDDLPF